MTKDFIIGSFVTDSVIDYPGEVCAGLFCYGCNFRCPYCFNAPLVLGPPDRSKYPRDEVLKELKRRKRFLTAVVLSGGEPTLFTDSVIELATALKEMGYKVKVDTNGSRSSQLFKLKESGVIDYVAMDIKTIPLFYSNLTMPLNFSQDKLTIEILTSIEVVKMFPEYEFRTTLVPGFHNEYTFRNILAMIDKVKRYTVQLYEEKPSVIASHDIKGFFSVQDLQKFRDILNSNSLIEKKYVNF